MSKSFFFKTLLFLFCTTRMSWAQLSIEALEARSEQRVERFLLSSDDGDIHSFIDENMSEMESEARKVTYQHLKDIRDRLKPYLNGIGIDAMDNALIFKLSSPKGQKDLKVILDHDNDLISRLEIQEPEQGMALTLENLNETFAQLEAQGYSGLVYVKIKGNAFFEKGFGWANKERQHKNDANTIFGIGSRPIDFTIAGIYLLKQQGKLKLDDTIGKYFKNVPDDKAKMTIRHLLTGKSGFPDFFDNEHDWDADLRYIDRQEAVRRLLSQDLLFAPGEGERHSHGAFGLLAAVIEMISGETYYSFIRKNFLDPAKMHRTGEYGETRGLKTSDFAIGHGISSVGIPNIPPNWGKTSWLVKGSGGMYSTLNDLLRFYTYARSGGVFTEEHNIFRGPTVNIDGSERGFELFSVHYPSDTTIFLFLNNQGDGGRTNDLMQSLEALARLHG